MTSKGGSTPQSQSGEPRSTSVIVARELNFRRERHGFSNTHGAVLYRAGRFEEAAKVLKECIRTHADGGNFRDWLFLALAEHRLGHTGAATEAAVKARALELLAKGSPTWDLAEVELLAAELNAALL
jgi:hypothetical protein